MVLQFSGTELEAGDCLVAICDSAWFDYGSQRHVNIIDGDNWIVYSLNNDHGCIELRDLCGRKIFMIKNWIQNNLSHYFRRLDP